MGPLRPCSNGVEVEEFIGFPRPQWRGGGEVHSPPAPHGVDEVDFIVYLLPHGVRFFPHPMARRWGRGGVHWPPHPTLW